MKAVSETERWAADTALTIFTDISGMILVREGQEFIAEDLCPPFCHELWNNIYPLVYTLQNGADLDYVDARAKMFDAKYPDECRVCVDGEIIEDMNSDLSIE